MSGPAPALASCAAGSPLPPAALVVFSGEADLWWLRLLRPGFRHCFALVDHGPAGWVVLDPLAGELELALLAPAPAEALRCWFEARGLTVVAARLARTAGRAAPWAPYTCVELVKRVLGVRRRWLLTPWQLYRHLSRTQATRPARP